jgi:hypothetical protein
MLRHLRTEVVDRRPSTVTSSPYTVDRPRRRLHHRLITLDVEQAEALRPSTAGG